MKDDREVIKQFVKIIERYPDIYDHNSDTYRRWCAEKAWKKVADCVRTELKEECNVDELKTKWKGIRSSYNRYKHKLFKSKKPIQAYYLSSVLEFLDPFIKPKLTLANETLSELSNESFNSETKMTNIDATNDYEHSIEWADVNIQSPKMLKTEDFSDGYLESEAETSYSKYKIEDKVEDDGNEDLQFFKSILPDIKDFTSKEKRDFKRGVLNLIDEIDNNRKK
ncbi:uncharacterized protein LOC113515563 [Galleria mellonella]|uniref:Uncharacterized protein LOC113515563 n=1 Tax=Galleria mellonella TaxID=7137 RepID=A0A6J1WTM9_GALME|nr:uncharacterized protein LOC113515563 [Galleria mellonella]XP_031768483.2 uncharacterized protein LOC113515563 [Galleria mellonella]